MFPVRESWDRIWNESSPWVIELKTSRNSKSSIPHHDTYYNIYDLLRSFPLCFGTVDLMDLITHVYKTASVCRSSVHYTRNVNYSCFLIQLYCCSLQILNYSDRKVAVCFTHILKRFKLMLIIIW